MSDVTCHQKSGKPNWYCDECDEVVAILDGRKGHDRTCRHYVPPCNGCGEPCDSEDMHFPHEADCPRRDDDNAICTCDLVAHKDCCGDCRNGSDHASVGAA